MDVDYDIIENSESRIKHLVINNVVGSTKRTVCGLRLLSQRDSKRFVDVLDVTMTMRKFWKSSWGCKNCKRAAKTITNERLFE